MAAEGKLAAVMQPYFFPYLGYWQLLAKVDVFVILEQTKYVKQSWINRNFVLGTRGSFLISVPLEKASDSSLIEHRQVSDAWTDTRGRALRTIRQSYRKSRFFEDIYPWLDEQLSFREKRLSKYLERQIRSTADLLSIDTKIVTARDLGDFVDLERDHRIFEICRSLECDRYLNLRGGRTLYSPDSFRKAEISLGFLSPELPRYGQGLQEFVPSLSIIDSLFWNGPRETGEMVRLGEVQWARN